MSEKENSTGSPRWISTTSGTVVLSIGLAIVLAVMSLCMVILCHCLTRRRRRTKDALVKKSSMTSKTTDPWLTGVFAAEPIQFVVPSNMSCAETTEESMSEPDTLVRPNGGSVIDRESRFRKRSSVNFFISPEEIAKDMYQESEKPTKKRSLLAGLGRLGFSVHYNVQRQLLCVRLIGATQLPSAFAKDSVNPFAKVVILPEKAPKFLTKVQRHTVNPTFNEVFAFPLKKDTVEDKEIRISVFDQDKFNRKVLIGHVRYVIKDIGINKNTFEDISTGDIWTDLSLEMEDEKTGQGDLLFSLCYNPETSTMTVVILKAKNVVEIAEKITNLYVKVSLYVRKRLVRTRKTVPKKYLPGEVEFGDSFNIVLPASALRDVDVVVTLCGKTTARGAGGKRVLGRTQVGADCTKESGQIHWQDMLASMRSTAAQWHQLAES